MRAGCSTSGASERPTGVFNQAFASALAGKHQFDHHEQLFARKVVRAAKRLDQLHVQSLRTFGGMVYVELDGLPLP